MTEEEQSPLNKKEKLLVEYLVSNTSLFVTCYKVLEPDYFDVPFTRVIEFVKHYFNEYQGLPTLDIIEAETETQLKERIIEEKDERLYVEEQVEDHCSKAAMRIAILDSVDDVESNNMGAVEQRIRDAMRVKIDNDIGINLFDDPLQRILQAEEDRDQRELGIKAIDTMIDCIKRSELGLFAAPTGGGKSLVLANIANLLAKQGLNVLIISLELRETIYSKRLDSVVTGTPIKELVNQSNKVVDKLESIKDQYGSIYVKKMRYRTPPSHIRAYLQEYQLMTKNVPDVFIVDYVDIMGSDAKRTEGKFDDDEIKMFSLFDMITEYNMYGFTASQLNRDAVNIIDVNKGHIAGGISKINASDYTIAMVQSEHDVDENIINLKQLKVRDTEKSNAPKCVYLNPKNLQITDDPPDPIKDMDYTTGNNGSPLTPRNTDNQKTGEDDDAVEEEATTSKRKSNKDALNQALKTLT